MREQTRKVISAPRLVMVAIVALALIGASATGSSAKPVRTSVEGAGSAHAAFTARFVAYNRDARTGAKLCLDADANKGLGALVSTVTCNGSIYQKWQPAGAGSQVVWENVGHRGLVLGANSLSTGSAAVLKRPSTTDRTVWWEYFGGSNRSVIANPPTNFAMNAIYGSGSAYNGRHVYINPLNDTSNQSWVQEIVG